MIKEAIKYITDLKAEAMEPKVVTIAGNGKSQGTEKSDYSRGFLAPFGGRNGDLY